MFFSKIESLVVIFKHSPYQAKFLQKVQQKKKVFFIA